MDGFFTLIAPGPLCWEMGTTLYTESTMSVTNCIRSRLTIANLYPNPATSSTRLSMQENVADATVSVVNASGKIVWKRTGIATTLVDINTTQWPSGEYWVVVRNASQKIATRKLIIQKQ